MYQERSLIFKVEGLENSSVQQVVQLFIGTLERYQKHIEGIRLINFSEKKYLITFKKFDGQPINKSCKEPVHGICKAGWSPKPGVKLTFIRIIIA